jgi:hypothetical protein
MIRMKTLILGFAVAMVAGTAVAEHRAFRSADGSKEIWGTVLDIVDSSKGHLVVMRLESGKKIKFPASSLSEADQEYISEASQRFAAGRELRLEITPNEEKSEPQLTRGRKIVTNDFGFDLTFTNTGQSELENLEVEYEIFYRKDKREGKTEHKRYDQSLSGTMKINSVKPKLEQTLTTQRVAIVSDKANKGGPG